MRGPQVEAATGLPARVTVYEVGPRDGLQNEGARPDRREGGSSSGGWSRPDCSSSRPPRSCHRRGYPSWATPGSSSRTWDRTRSGATGRSWFPTRRGWTGRWRPASRRSPSSGAPRRPSRATTSAGAWTSRSRCSGRSWPGPRGGPLGPWLRVDVLRRSVGGGRPGRPGRRRRSTDERPGSGPAMPRRHDRRRDDRPRAPVVDALDARGSSSTWVCISTTPTARR